MDTDDKVITFIDKYTSTCLPNKKKQNQELCNLVCTLQTHHHTSTCKKKKNVACIMGFPRPPTFETVIAREPNTENIATEKQFARNILKKVYDSLLEIDVNNVPNLQEILYENKITEGGYKKAMSISSNQTKILMKHSTQDMNINNYNAVVLSSLKPKMDIQYITNIYEIKIWERCYETAGNTQCS